MKFYLLLAGTFLAVAIQNTAAQSSTVLLEEMTWQEIQEALRNGTDTAVITVGATEQHGPQIAVASDSVTGDYLGPRIAEIVGRALVAPNIRVGVSPHHLHFPGTISVRTEILAELIREYVHSLAWHGFRHIAIIPTHGGNFTTVERVGREISSLYPHLNIMAFSDAPGYIDTLKSTSERLNIDLEVAGSHSGLSETSMILAARPDLVRMDKAEKGFMGDAYGVGDKMNEEGTHSVSPIGVLGDPRGATAEAGEAYLNDLAAFLADFVRHGRDQWTATAPGDIPYGGLAEPEGPLAPGIQARRRGEYSKARRFFQARLKKTQDDVAALLELARTDTLEGHFAEARRSLEPLLQHQDPMTREEADDELALIDLYQGRFNDAIAHKQTARTLRAEKGDRRGEAHKLFYVGYIQTETGELDAATETYREALGLAPTLSDLNLDLQHLMGVLEVRQGRLHKAGDRARLIGDATLQEQFAPHIRRFYHLNGEILLARGRADDALFNFPLAIQSYDHPLYREALARAYIAAGRLPEADSELTHLIELTDARLDIPIHYVKAHYQLGKLYERMERPGEAKAMYTQFLAFWGDADTPVAEIQAAQGALGRLGGTQ